MQRSKSFRMHNRESIEFCLDYEDQNLKFNPYNKWEI